MTSNQFEFLTMSSSSHSQGVVHVRGRRHCICWEVERPHQVMNVNKRVEFGHLLGLNDVTADPHYPRNKAKETKMEDANMYLYLEKALHIKPRVQRFLH